MKYVAWEYKPRPAFGCKQKTFFWPHVATFFLLFLNFYIFHAKNSKKGYLHKRLECAAPKHWLKYTT